MVKDCWQATIQIDQFKSIGYVSELITRLRARPSLLVHYSTEHCQLVVTLHEPSRLGNAPNGTHEYARGWLNCRDANFVNYLIKERITWKPIKLYDNMEVIPDSSRSEFVTVHWT